MKLSLAKERRYPRSRVSSGGGACFVVWCGHFVGLPALVCSVFWSLHLFHDQPLRTKVASASGFRVRLAVWQLHLCSPACRGARVICTPSCQVAAMLLRRGQCAFRRVARRTFLLIWMRRSRERRMSQHLAQPTYSRHLFSVGNSQLRPWGSLDDSRQVSMPQLPELWVQSAFQQSVASATH